MAKKYIDIMDTTFRDGFQSVFGGRVLMDDFLPAVAAAREAGISHFEFGGGARFQTLFFYLQENAFEMMDKFREAAGTDANLQILARGINTVTLDTGSREMIDLFAKLFKKHGTTTVRNFDALNDVNNLIYSGECIKKHGMKHEVVVTMMDLPPGCVGAHDVPFYEKTLRGILESGLEFDSVCFKDASGTSHPKKVFETLSMARRLLGEKTHLRLHTHETAGVSVACYLAALDAGADGIDMAAAPVSGGTSQPDMLTMLHAVKGSNYNLGNLELSKILKYEAKLHECLHDYMIPLEATQVSPLIPFSPMPGGALTANTQMMRDNGNFHRFEEVILAMEEVVERGGYGTSVTPVSQFYWQQAYENAIFGLWTHIAPGYGRMVLGYFGKTPVDPDPKIVALASEKLGIPPTTENPLDIADADKTKSIAHWIKVLEDEGLEVNDENIFIGASCEMKGIDFLKGESPLMVRKKSDEKIERQKEIKDMAGNYTVVVDGKKYSVQVAEGDGDIQIVPSHQAAGSASVQPNANEAEASGEKIYSQTPGKIWKIFVSAGESIKAGQKMMILEAMKMEIDIVAPKDGIIVAINVKANDNVAEGQLLATLE